MVSTCSSGLNDLASNSGFTFKDFFPECRDPGGVFTTPVYGTFGTLIDRANEWLRVNRKWKITTCESVEFRAKGETVEYSKMTYLEYGELSTWYVRGLRLWLTERKNGREREQQIGYLNFTPATVEEGGLLNAPTYETLDEVVRRLNTMLQSNPLPGPVITVESQEMKVSNFHEFDPDRCSWRERGDKRKRFLFVIRVFYELTDGCPEEIGIKDFVPLSVSKGGVFSFPEYEPFSNVVQNASDWCRQQRGIRYCNAQSLELKLKTGGEIDTQKMGYTEYGHKITLYVRILRVCYAKTPANLSLQKDLPLSITQLTCKTFVPVQLKTSIFVPEYETLKETKERVTAWVNATGAHVVSAETTALRILTGGDAKHGAESSFTFNRAERNEYWVFVIRLYLDGFYREPPPQMLPPVPAVESGCCCVIL